MAFYRRYQPNDCRNNRDNLILRRYLRTPSPHYRKAATPFYTSPICPRKPLKCLADKFCNIHSILLTWRFHISICFPPSRMHCLAIFSIMKRNLRHFWTLYSRQNKVFFKPSRHSKACLKLEKSYK